MTYPNLTNSVVKNIGWCTARAIRNSKNKYDTLILHSPSMIDEDGKNYAVQDIWIYGEKELITLYHFLRDLQLDKND